MDESETPIASTSGSPAPVEAAEEHVLSVPEANRRRTVIKEGDSVLFELPSKNVKLVKLTPATNIINLGKYGAFDVRQELIGKPYGVTYEVVVPAAGSSGSATPVNNDGDQEESAATEQGQQEVASGDSESKSNSKKNKKNPKSAKGQRENAPTVLSTLRPFVRLTDAEIELTEATNENISATGAKTLTHEEIQDLKRQGLDGRDIIARQIAEHEAFELKNEYSKAKYQRRKETKYMKYFTALAPTTHNICQYYHDGDARRIRDLRPDTLAQMLTLANVRPGARVIVVDDASGIVVAAVAERLAGQGLLYQISQNDSPPANPAVPLFNFPKEYVTSPVYKSIHWGWTDDSWEADDPAEEEEQAGEQSDKQRARSNKRRFAKDALLATVQQFKEGGFDAAIICSMYEPMSILTRLLPALAGSAQIVVQCPMIQPLSEMLQALIPLNTVLNPTILEPWLRQYQVLPGRTHPEMNGTAHGGFILHATRVVDATEPGKVTAMGKGDRKGFKRRR